jgi:hypothetical protein
MRGISAPTHRVTFAVRRKPQTAFDGLETSCAKPLEIEIGVLRSQCLNRRIDSKEHLVSEIAACAHRVILHVAA